MELVRFDVFFVKNRAIGRGNHQNAIRTQNATDFGEHLFLLGKMLNCFKRDNHIKMGIRELQVSSTALLEFQIFFYVAGRSMCNGLR